MFSVSKPNKSAKKIEDDSSSSEDESVDEHDIGNVYKCLNYYLDIHNPIL